MSFLIGTFLQVPSGSVTKTQITLHANGLSVAHLGSRESEVESALVGLLGKPSKALSATPGLSNCGIDASASWRSFSAYFNHGRLVGLSLGPGRIPSGETSQGLRLGDTLSRAKSIYGTSLRTSTNQGGAWFIKTDQGRLDGFLVPSTGRAPGPRARIWTIDVGVVGCPAMSP